MKGRVKTPNQVADECLRRNVSLDTLYRAHTQLRTGSESLKKKRRIYLARRKYLSYLLLGRRSGAFLMRFIKADREKQEVFAQKEIERISKRRGVTNEKAAQILRDYVTELSKRLALGRNNLVQRHAWGISLPLDEAGKADTVRHDFLDLTCQDMTSALERIAEKCGEKK